MNEETRGVLEDSGADERTAREVLEDSLTGSLEYFQAVTGWVTTAQIGYDRAFEALKDAEAALLLGRGPVQIDGKNAEVRAAQIREATAAERKAVQDASEELTSARLTLDYARQQCSILKALVRLATSGEDE